MFARPTVLLAAVWVLVLHAILEQLAFPVLILGPLDWSAHVATALILLANLPRRPSRAFTAAALVAAFAVDLDHIPQYLGTDVLTEGTPRPYPHSLTTVLLAAAAAAALSGRARAVAAGVAFGLLAHLARDISTGDGVALAWPFTSAGVLIPFWLEAAVIGALAMRGWQRARDEPGCRRAGPKAAASPSS